MFIGGRKRKSKRFLARLMLTVILVMTVLQQGTITSYASEGGLPEEVVSDNSKMAEDSGYFADNAMETIAGNEAAEDKEAKKEESAVEKSALEEHATESEANAEAGTQERTENANADTQESLENAETDTQENAENLDTQISTEEVTDTTKSDENSETAGVNSAEDSTDAVNDIEPDTESVVEDANEEDIFTAKEVQLNDAEPTDSVKILMVGNSLTRYNDVAGKLTALYALDGITAQVDTRTQMGASLFDQADILKDSTREAIVNGDYDFVILQEKSSGFSEALLRQGAEAFYPWIEEAPSQPQLVFYMPWANEDVLKSMQTNVTDAYVSVAKDFNAKLAPAGEAYYELYFDKNKKWYRKGDNVHGNDLASLISASTIYYTLTGKEAAFSFTSEDTEALKALVESGDYKNNRVSYNAETVNLIESTSLKYTEIYKDLSNVPNLEGRGMDGNTNLAKGKQGSASSNGRGSTRGIGARNVGNLTDGSYTSFLVSHEEDPDIWYAVDFGKSTKLDEVTLYFGGTGTYVNTEHAVFTVEMSDTYDSDYRVVASGESTSTEPIDIKFDEAEGRYLRVHVSSFSGPFVSMFEIEAYYQRPEQTDEPGEEQPGDIEEPAEPEEPEPVPQEPQEEEDGDVTIKAFPGDYLQLKVGDMTTDMDYYDDNMYEAILPFNSGDNTISILANGKVIKERQITASNAEQNVIVRYFADKDKIVTGFDSHKDANGNVVQDIKKTAHWTGNFFNRTGINEFKEFGGWDQANMPSCLDYIGGGVFKRIYTYTVPENSVSYEFKINFDKAWSNGEVPSSNATVTFPASDKETDTFVLFVNSITGEWFDSINKGKLAYKLADGSTYEQEAGKAHITISYGGAAEEMVQTSLDKFRHTDYLTAGEHVASVYVDDQLIETAKFSLGSASSVTAVYDANKGLELIKRDNTKEPENEDVSGTVPENKPENGSGTQNKSDNKPEKVDDAQAPAPSETPAEIVDAEQKKSNIAEISAGKKSFTVKWKKLKDKEIKGYEIQYSTDKSFKKSVKSVFVKRTKTSKKISKLKGGKKYYVRIRTYKSSGDNKIFSKWSKKKSVKTLK
ncbi:discoidin domain-containing protein [Butyrivibrio sp. JL13D10]|uniref:discoidin domain-containing protein n=1 Tax=Butyrivibrio sp. JL13D10 TaxID=3236815 RepID=UPI0038B4CD4C